ncbi:MAG: hypothetical protein IPJ49_24820 [Candidatus Obscuribacter sp.]|nr:hypothetical protein [Candidatus Obscuribacter sp.]
MADDQKYPFCVTARIDECIGPMDRGERYEDPLMEALQGRGLGEVTGGGTQLDENNQIVCADIEMYLLNLDEALSFARETLLKLGVPYGSHITFERDGEIVSEPIGDAECLGIYLDGVGLPDEVYAQLDFDEFFASLASELKLVGELRGIQQSDEETGLFVFGPSADEIYATLQSMPVKASILQNARIAFKRKDADKLPKEVRLPESG